MSVQVERFQGGRNWMLGGMVGGLLLLIATFAGLAGDEETARETMFSYLTAFSYWAGIALAALVLIMIFHAFKAKWMVVIRRPLEAMATTIALFAVLFIPIVLGLKRLYIWIDPPESLGREALHILHNKHVYLNPTFFVVRSVIYLLYAVLLSQLFWRWSTRQDETGALDLTRKARVLGPAGLPFMAMVFSFAAFDWLMSLNPLWFSTIFGVYYFAGSFVSVFAMLAVVTDAARGKNLFGAVISKEHTHNIGKLMLAFTSFWGYIAFSQFMLIWIANLPEEVPFFIVRFKPGWAWMGIFLIIGHFFIPFSALLSRSLKRDRRKLAAVGVWILLIHFVDIYWLVMPTVRPDGFSLHWTTITAFLGVGLLGIAFTVWRLRGRFTIPVKDPYLAESLRYKQP